MTPLLQNLLIACLMLGFAGMELASRRYQCTVRATANDTWLEAAMFVSLVAVAQPLALLATDALCAWAFPGARGA